MHECFVHVMNYCDQFEGSHTNVMRKDLSI